MVKCAVENCEQVGKYRFKQLHKTEIVDLPLRCIKNQKLCEVILFSHNSCFMNLNDLRTRNITTTFSEIKSMMNGTALCTKTA